MLTHYFRSAPPLYDIHKTYQENVESGPCFTEEIPTRVFPPKEKWLRLFDCDIASPLGVPAGPLLSAEWTTLAAKLGFDIVTYKTIRSASHLAHPLPNIIFVDASKQRQTSSLPENIEDLAITNSFGMPSQSPDFLLEDISRANRDLSPGQLLIVSVVGTPREGEDFIQDFVSAALLAKEAGAKVIEANFSCPNVEKREGALYASPESVFKIASALVKAIHPIPLIIKVGLFALREEMRAVMVAAARAGVRGFAGLNSVSMKITDMHGSSALGAHRPTSGVCGGPIREKALAFIRIAKEINVKEKLDLTLLGVGGITKPEHFSQFLEAGADAAMSATGMMWDPYLAMKWHQH